MSSFDVGIIMGIIIGAIGGWWVELLILEWARRRARSREDWR